MHFALPPKGAQSTPYNHSSRGPSSLRQRPLQVTAIVAVAFCTFYLLLSFLFGGNDLEIIPAGAPKIVIVTVFDEKSMSKEYIEKIKQNRQDYAQRHGYANFFTNITTYKPYIGNSPSSWSIVPAVRHAMTVHPHSAWYFSLSPHSLIMSPSIDLYDHVLEPNRLSSLMMKDVPVVPPDSVIHTFSHLKPEKVDLILTQDGESLAHGSFLLKRGDWAKFFLDSWFDGLYRSYNFQKAEGHALEHLVQWHPTILSHLVLIPQRIINSYNFESQSKSSKASKADSNNKHDSLFNDSDLLVHLYGCDQTSQNQKDKEAARNCEKEFEGYLGRWRETIGREKGGRG